MDSNINVLWAYLIGACNLHGCEGCEICLKVTCIKGQSWTPEGRDCFMDDFLLFVQVDGQPLQGYTNHQAVEVLRNTSQMVHLRLARFRHGPKYEKLQQYLGCLLYTSPSPRDMYKSRMPSSA